MSGLKYLSAKHEKFYTDPTRIVVAGESGGGNLALATGMRLGTQVGIVCVCVCVCARARVCVCVCVCVCARARAHPGGMRESSLGAIGEPVA